MTAKHTVVAVALAAILALGLLVPAAAPAATEGRLTLKLDRGLQTSLNRGGATLRGLKPALGRGRIINLPVRGGGLEYSGEGRLVTAGGLEFAAGGRRAVFGDLVLDTAFGMLSGKLDGRRLAIAGAFGLSSERKGFAIVVGLRRLRLTRSAARAIDARLGTPGLLRAGQPLASAVGIGRAEQIPVLDGRTYLDVGDAFFEKLRTLKVNTKPIGNSWALGTYFAVPDTVGPVALDFSSGRLASDDGFALRQFESNAALELHNVSYDLGAGLVKAGITTRYTLPSEARLTTLARFRVTVTHKNAYTGELSANATGALTAAFAGRLNEAFAEPKGLAPPFAGGEPITIGFSLQTRR